MLALAPLLGSGHSSHSTLCNYLRFLGPELHVMTNIAPRPETYEFPPQQLYWQLHS
jgi:hypothetical protein